jgi:hypothetical protein
MAYPEPTPVLKGKAAEEFLKRLESFKLNEEQKRLYRGAIKYYEKLCPKSPDQKVRHRRIRRAVQGTSRNDSYISDSVQSDNLMQRFSHSGADMEFRRVVRQRLDSARRSVRVVTGEFSAFSNYLELQWAVERAINRGVKFRVYAHSLDPGIARKLMNWGAELYLGKDCGGDHFMIVDGHDVVVSEKHAPSSIGERHGYLTSDARPFQNSFNTLIRRGRRLRRVAGEDPLQALLHRPIEIEIKNASRHVDDSYG